MLARYGHFLAGITWIGLLYYFNFVQVPAFAQMEAGARSEALRKVTFRALWWFRWGAMLTFATGVLILGLQRALGSEFSDYFSTTVGLSIAWGALLATTMFLNVWLVIWPAQKIVIGSAESVAGGGEEDPRAAASAKKAGRASRANTMMSIPMLWFMGFTSHFSSAYGQDGGFGYPGWVWIVFLAVLAFIELSALGVLGGYDSPQAKLFFDTHRNTIIYGFVTWVVLYFVVFEGIIGGNS
ncbi:MAG: urate hydroxylase PuuD [Actinobacteria bacterium]|nr:urate hydroxylase PuuD [Actinomycetota bacterium]